MRQSKLSWRDLLIAFGHDYTTRYFSSVYDFQLRYNGDNSHEPDTLSEQTSPYGSGFI